MRRLRRVLLGGGMVVAGLLVLGLAAWAVAWGPGTVWNALVHQDTAIDDFQHFPGRQLQRTANPFRFSEQLGRLSTPAWLASDTPVHEHLAANDTVAFLVVHDDAIVYERYFGGADADTPWQLFSVSKSVLSMLIGAAIEDGYLESVEQPVTDLVPELAAAGYEAVTLEHLLNMTSGMDYDENDIPWGQHVAFNYTPQLEAEIVKLRLRGVPGADWSYGSGDTALLGLALHRALGEQTVTGYLQERLWSPLGMEHDGVFSTDHDGGLERSWCCLAATARDLAKLGRLYLNAGVWEGEQLLSAAWVDASIGPGSFDESVLPADYAAATGLTDHRYSWWLASAERGSFMAWGKDGQLLYVDPSTDVIIVRQGWSQGDLRLRDWIRLFDSIADEFM